MSTEEDVVLRFLEENPETWFSRREIARKAVHRSEFEENPNWATAAISGLITRSKVEENESGSIRLKPRNW